MARRRWPDGFPRRRDGADNRPGITGARRGPFGRLVEVLRQGHGAEVESGDQVPVPTGVGWEDNGVLDSTW